MTNFINARFGYSLIVYIIIVTIVFIARPSVIFKDENSLLPLPFGTGYNSTIVSLGVVIMLAAIFSFYLGLWLYR